MKILLDHQTFSTQRYGGISRYFANLHHGINNTQEHSSDLGVLFTNNAYVEEDQAFPLLSRLIKEEPKRYKYNKWYSRHLIRKDKHDIFHPTYYHSYFLKSNKRPFVLTVHDMIHELYPQYFEHDAYKDYKDQVIEKADHLIAISHSTKRDIQRFYKIPDEKITVVHHGYKMTDQQPSSVSTGINSPYLLFIGDRNGYKNFELMAQAAVPLLRTAGLELVCAGGGKFTAKELAFFDELKISGLVRQISAEDAMLKALYGGAVAFIYPSLYEGFGLPVLEAFANGCPVIMSNTSSLPEVGGDAAQYFEPLDKASLADAIEKVVNNNNLRQELKQKGTQRLQQFAFDNCLQQTLQVYSKLL